MPSTPAHQDSAVKSPRDLIRKEPVLVERAVLWLLLNLGAFVVGRTHLVSSAEWSAWATAATPTITGAVLFGQAWLIRRYVTPAWKAARRAAARDGLALPDLAGTGLADLAAAMVAAGPPRPARDADEPGTGQLFPSP